MQNAMRLSPSWAFAAAMKLGQSKHSEAASPLKSQPSILAPARFA